MKKTLLFVFVSVLALGVYVFAEDAATGTTADTGATTTVTTETTTVTTTTSTDAIACVKTALEKRESGIKGAMDTYYASRGTAFTARTTAFINALSLTVKKEVKKAIDAAWKTYKKAIETAKKTRKGSVQTTWSTYRTDVKACKGDLAKMLKQENGKSDLND